MTSIRGAVNTNSVKACPRQKGLPDRVERPGPAPFSRLYPGAKKHPCLSFRNKELDFISVNIPLYISHFFPTYHHRIPSIRQAIKIRVLDTKYLYKSLSIYFIKLRVKTSNQFTIKFRVFLSLTPNIMNIILYLIKR